MAQPTKKRGVKVAFANLPENYRKAVGGFSVTDVVDDIATEHALTDQQTLDLDDEVTYLLLLIQSTEHFMASVEDKLGISEQKVAKITESVTEEILRPLEEKMDKKGANMPVPTPPEPSDTAPSPDYGGTSDPYREPTENS